MLWQIMEWSTTDFYDLYDPQAAESPKSSTELLDINETSVTFNARVLSSGSTSGSTFTGYFVDEQFAPVDYLQETEEPEIPYAGYTKFGFQLSVSPLFSSSSTVQFYVDENDSYKLLKNLDDYIYKSNYTTLGNEDNGTLDDEYLISISLDQLELGRTYYFRSFIEDDYGSTGYGDSKEFVAKRPNDPPTALRLNITSIKEDAPAGSIIGIFEADDPDGDALTFELIESANKDTNLFSLASNGQLSIKRALDFETDPKEFGLVVVVRDVEGLSISKEFFFSLVDVYEDNDGDKVEDHLDPDDDNDGFDDETEKSLGFDPFDRFSKPQMGIVTGLGEEQVSVGKYKLRARIDAFGDPKFTEVGFVIGSSLRDLNVIIPAEGPISSSNEYSVDIASLITGETYFYKPYIESAVGKSFGSPGKFEVTGGKWWSNAELYQGGWRINWLGTFLPNENGWIYHIDLGWAYVQSDDSDGLWLWMDSKGWVWTNPEASPFLWSSNTSNWLYPIKKINGVMRFYDYSTSSLLAE
jgi:hypothetical protein